jgi:periplasmic protein TonB
MKSKKEKVPEFDEIIFENRNKSYGAFDLRKHYKSTTSISILSGVAFFVLLALAITLTTEKGTAINSPVIDIIEMSNPITQEQISQPAIKPPPELIKAIKNLQPVLTDDTTQITSMVPTNDDLLRTVTNGNLNDTINKYTDDPEPIIPAEEKIFISVEEMPEFPGGNTELLKFIGESINYPHDAQINNIQGRVILKFVVNTDGSVDRIEILRSIDPSLDNEAVRVVRSLPRFKPGKQGGIPVPVWFSLPVTFRIVNN